MILKNITLLVLLFLCQTTFSQIKFLQQEKDKNGNIVFVELDSSVKISTNRTQELLKQIALPSKNISFKFLRNFEDNENYSHNIFQAYYDTLEIFGMGYAVHEKNNLIKYANGYSQKLEGVKTIPAISQNVALELAYKNYNPATSDAVIKDTKLQQMLLYKNSVGNYVLAYKILIESNIANSSCFIFLDAENGEILFKEPIYCSSHDQVEIPPYIAGNAQTKYSGNQNIVTDSYLGYFRLRELRNGVNIITRNALNTDNETYIASFATDFIDAANTWTLSNQGADQPATDVHWGSEKVLDYWRIEQGRNSINGLGMDLKNYVHYGTSYSGANAYWTGTNSSSIPNSMSYGDGNIYYKPFTSLDICAHELGHGICQFTAGLLGGPAESGALNEGFSDIWAVVIEGWAAPTKQKWLLAEEIVQIPNKTCIRNLQNPKDIQQTTGQHPNTYGGQFWDAQNLLSHNNSLILSHWFYILSEGKSGINDLSNSYNVLGLGMIKAAKIAYMTEQNLSPFDSYAQTRYISIQVTRNFFGIGSCEEIAVTNSWYAVGVGVAYQFGNPGINGPSQICSSGSTFSISNIPCNTTILWSVTSSNGTGITLNNYFGSSTSINIPALFPQNSIITLNATIPNQPYNVVKTIYYGIPQNIFNVTTSANVFKCNVRSYKHTISGGVGATNYAWHVSNITQGTPFTLVQTTSQNFISMGGDESCDQIMIRVMASNACVTGSTRPPSFTFPSDLCPIYIDGSCTSGRYLVASPNPSISYINLCLVDEENVKPKNTQPLKIEMIRIVDKSGQIRKTMNGNKLETMKIDISDLASDIYTIIVSDGKNWMSTQISKK